MVPAPHASVRAVIGVGANALSTRVAKRFLARFLCLFRRFFALPTPRRPNDPKQTAKRRRQMGEKQQQVTRALGRCCAGTLLLYILVVSIGMQMNIL